MTTPPPIAFEPAAKPAPTRRDTGSGGEAHSFADTMQAQRADNHRSAGTAQGASDAAQPQRDQAAARTGQDARPGQGNGERPSNPASGANANQSASAQSKADMTSAPGRTGEQTAAKVAEAAAKVAATGTQTAAKAAQAQTQAAAEAARALAGQAGAQPTGATQTGTSQTGTSQTGTSQAGALARGDAQPVQIAVQQVSKGQARPVNAATAVAAHTAGASAQEAGQTGQQAKTTDAAAAKATAADAKAGDDPTAKALRDALSGVRDAGGNRRGDDAAEANGARLEARPTTQRASGGGMSPALRAAAEAVQQQLNGAGGSTGTAGAAGASNAASAAVGQPQARIDAGAAPLQGQTFDAVLQNTGPQPGGAGQPGSLAAAGKAAATAGTGAGNPAPAVPPAEQVAVQIQRAAAQGQSKVQIRLNPAELGRIDVKLDVGDDGHVRAVLAVDKPETLDLMQRDPRALERALQAAGLKTDQGSLSFNLRDDGTGGGQNAGGDGRDAPGEPADGLAGQPTGEAPIPAEPLRARLPADGRVDIRV
jgi:hypothetical protein